VFLTLLVVGLVGLGLMAVPAFGGHHHLFGVRGHGHAPLGGHAHDLGLTRGNASSVGLAQRFLPSPRGVFSVVALYGAFGNALVHAAHLQRGAAALLAIAPALAIEWVLVRPIWNLLYRFQGQASAPLEALILSEAEAVVPFRNGRGLVATVRDGRRVQLSARLCDGQAASPIAFGQRLRIEDVDARRECVTVSILPNDKSSGQAS
jgi:hypothetical protein